MARSIAEVEAGILDDPEDGAAWQAYVPWLRAQGDVRAELIDLVSEADTPARSAMLAAWAAEGRARYTPNGVVASECDWRHGFVVGASVRVGHRQGVRWLVELLADPQARLLGRLDLEIDAAVPTRSLARLDRADLRRLRWLRAAYNARGNRVARALAGQPALHLRSLDLRHSGLTDDGLLALAGCERLRGLRSLYLQHNRFTAVGVAALAGSPALAEVTVLDLRYNPIGAAGAAALAESPQLGGVTRLHLYAAEVGVDGVRALGSSRTLPRDVVRFWRAQGAAR
jgi:hypothetical protein